MPNEDKQTTSEEVLAAIKAKGISMRSKKYFMLHAALLVLSMLVLFTALLYLASFIAFGALETGLWFIPSFGLWGWIVFFRSLPWILILLTLLFVFVLETLVRHYSFAYRRPLLYSMLGIVTLVVIGGFFISHSHFHKQLPEFARTYHIRGVGRFYREFGTPRFTNVHRGVVQEILSSGFILTRRGGETSTILISSSTRLPYGGGFLASDTVVIFGDERNRTVHAFGIRRVAP